MTRTATKASAPAVPAPVMVRSRWRKTQTTFGPVGRVLATIGLVVPMIGFVWLAYFSGGLIDGGAVGWGLFVMPWGLRDVWKAGKLAAG